MNYKTYFYRLGGIMILLWIAMLVILHSQLNLLGLTLIAFTLGLRHGFDADHIVAIDNITRKLTAENRPSLNTGLYFALGHSTIVFIMTLLIIFGAIAFKTTFADMQNIGAIIGTLVSVTFLWFTGAMNLHTLKMVRNDTHQHSHQVSGVMNKLFGKIFSKIDSPRKMYFVGFVFGLGFDTATEIALLGIAATSMIQGISPWYVMLLPVAFASGMVITDSIDAAIMTSMCRWASSQKARFKIYNTIIISFAFVMSITIGLIELIGLFATNSDAQNLLMTIVDFAGDYSEWIGVSIFSSFMVIWLFSVWNKQRKLTAMQ